MNSINLLFFSAVASCSVPCQCKLITKEDAVRVFQKRAPMLEWRNQDYVMNDVIWKKEKYILEPAG